MRIDIDTRAQVIECFKCFRGHDYENMKMKRSFKDRIDANIIRTKHLQTRRNRHFEEY